MKRADPPPPTSLEGQFLIAMPSLREGPFARSVVYLCAHREDGAMGLIINQRADEIDFAELLVQLDIVPGGKEIRLPLARRGGQGAARRPGRDRARLRAPFRRLWRDRFDGQDRRRRLPDGDDRHPARHRHRARARRTAVLALGYAGWSSGQLESEILANGWLTCPADADLIFDARFRPANTTGRWRCSASTRACCRPTPVTPDASQLRAAAARYASPAPRSAETSNISALPCRIAKAAGSAPVRNTWPPRRVSASNSAARALRVEMRRDFVEERQRRDARHVRDEARMREHEPDQQRLLLAGRGAARRRVLRPVPDGEIADMRADQRPPGGRVAGAIVAQQPRGSGPRPRAPGRWPRAPRPRPEARAAPRERAKRRRARRRSAPRAG